MTLRDKVFRVLFRLASQREDDEALLETRIDQIVAERAKLRRALTLLEREETAARSALRASYAMRQFEARMFPYGGVKLPEMPEGDETPERAA